MEENKINQPKQNPLWTRDFTIITAGSIVSMLGNALAGFAMSLLVLDYTGSTLLFALYNFFYILPDIIMPIISGPFLDRFSRKKTIYTLDFLTAGIYIVLALILKTGYFNFAILIAGAFFLGAIDSVYMVAYQSFYPLLITEGNYTKAYSIASTLETLAMVMVPVSALIYNTFGIVPLFLCNAGTYFIAAVMETQIKAEEKYISKQKAELDMQNTISGYKNSVMKQFSIDFREGMSYLFREKGLLAIAAYFTFSSLFGGVSGAITLPFFKANFTNGEYVYMLVWGMSSVGRAIGGAVHYKTKIKTSAKYTVALTVYIVISVLEGVYLYLPVGIMMVMCFMNGILGVTSYNIRISATQSYVPDEKKGRFNAAFTMLNTVGCLLGELFAGIFSIVIPERMIITIFSAVCAAAAVIFIGGSKKSVSAIYNTQV